MTSPRLTNDFREIVVADMLAKLDLSHIVRAEHQAAQEVRRAIAGHVDRVVGNDIVALVRHDSAAWVSSIVIRVPRKPADYSDTRAVRVYFESRKKNGERPWRTEVQLDTDRAVLVPRRWVDDSGYGVSSDSGGRHMPEKVRAALEPLALAYERAGEAVTKAQRDYGHTLEAALASARTVAEGEEVWPGTAALWAEAERMNGVCEGERFKAREAARVRMMTIPVGRARK